MKKVVIFLTVLLFNFALASNSVASARVSYATAVHGNSVPIPESVIINLCGDFDGCELRLGMYNWDGTRRVASRESVFYYDKATRNWRASRSDKAGTNNNHVTQHVMQAWTCYFTDGYYHHFINAGDFTTNFALLAWKSYPKSQCRISIID